MRKKLPPRGVFKGLHPRLAYLLTVQGREGLNAEQIRELDRLKRDYDYTGPGVIDSTPTDHALERPPVLLTRSRGVDR